ncbi:hypothetical protein D0T50_08455 [Bacteroides sp. 214]|nr:hypothetical protein [Bacteroides sp. 214]
MSQLALLKQYVVEINEEGLVINLFPLTEELHSVSWLPGLLVLHKGEFSPVDINSIRKFVHAKSLSPEMLHTITSSEYQLTQVPAFDFSTLFS